MEKIVELDELQAVGHIGKEAKEYAEDGIRAYEKIGGMYRESMILDKSKLQREELRWKRDR